MVNLLCACSHSCTTTFDLFWSWQCVFFTPLGLGRNLLSSTKWGQQRSLGAVKHTTHLLLLSQDPIIHSISMAEGNEWSQVIASLHQLHPFWLYFSFTMSGFPRGCGHMLIKIFIKIYLITFSGINSSVKLKTGPVSHLRQFSSLTKDYWELVWIDV